MAALVTRRRILTDALTAPLFLSPLAMSATRCDRAKKPPAQWLVAAQGSDASTFGLGWAPLTTQAAETEEAEQLPVGFRGHDAVAHPLRSRRVVLVARHPGREMVEVDLVEGRITRRIRCAKDHVHGGHACFSADGHLLFTAEVDYAKGEGRIIVRDSLDYRQLAEFPSYGVGPHELLLMPDGKTLAVANGGLLTHPERPGEVLNLHTMTSTLTLIASDSGAQLQAFRVDEPKASIRHLSLSDRGELSVALQMQRAASTHQHLAPLAAIYRPERGLEVLHGPEALLWHCEDYMGSTRINNRTRIAGFTSPRGNIALFWHLDRRELVGYHRFHDVCGLAVNPAQDSFLLSNSAGQLRCLDASTLQERPDQALDLPAFAWDNHLHAFTWPTT